MRTDCSDPWRLHCAVPNVLACVRCISELRRLPERFYRLALQSADPENDLLRSDVLLELASVLVQQKQLDAAEALAN